MGTLPSIRRTLSSVESLEDTEFLCVLIFVLMVQIREQSSTGDCTLLSPSNPSQPPIHNVADLPSEIHILSQESLRVNSSQETRRRGFRKRRRRVSKNKSSTRSDVWLFFEKLNKPGDVDQRARCLYCSSTLDAKVANGTSSLWRHSNACDATQKAIEDGTVVVPMPRGKGKYTNWQFDQQRALDALSKFLILCEVPFCIVEKIGFKSLIAEIQPLFKLPSRKIATVNCYEMYLSEKSKLMAFLKTHSQRVSITTDTWTSLQRQSYMCITLHFIDDSWNLHKMILNFCPIDSHKGDELGKAIQICLNDWGIERLFTITVDNASANSGCVNYLRKKVVRCGWSIARGKYMHMRCVAHIVNLVVSEGLRSEKEKAAISHIRAAVAFVRSSSSRYKNFCDRAKLEKLDSNKMVCLDVKTRWNSTFLMLEAAVAHQKAFEACEDEDPSYRIELGNDVPTSGDWQRAKVLVIFLRNFYNLTLRVSGAKYVTSNVVFDQLYMVERLLKRWLASDDTDLREMAKKMKEKYQKYWGPVRNMNLMIYYAVILDPREKLESLKFKFGRMYPPNDKSPVTITSPTARSPGASVNFFEKVKKGFEDLFLEYKGLYGHDTPTAPSPQVVGSTSRELQADCDMELLDEDDDFHRARKKLKGKERTVQSELDRYLSEDCIEEAGDFDILGW